MKKWLVLTVVAAVLLTGFAFGSDLSGLVNVAAEPKPGV